jgi:hypothetical protein
MKLRTQIKTYHMDEIDVQRNHTTWMKLMHKGTMPYMDEIAHGRR